MKICDNCGKDHGFGFACEKCGFIDTPETDIAIEKLEQDQDNDIKELRKAGYKL